MKINVPYVNRNKNPIWSAKIYCSVSLFLYWAFEVRSKSHSCCDATPTSISNWKSSSKHVPGGTLSHAVKLSINWNMSTKRENVYKQGKGKIKRKCFTEYCICIKSALFLWLQFCLLRRFFFTRSYTINLVG
jgi:hypothetical protein